MTADTVERVARAIHGASCIAEPWDYLMEFQRLRYMDQARAAIAALQPPTVAEAARVLVQRIIDLPMPETSDEAADMLLSLRQAAMGLIKEGDAG